LGIGVIPFSPAAVYAAQVVLVPGIVAFATRVCARNRAAMKRNAVVGIDGSWNHRRNGSAHVIDMIDVDSGRVVDFEVVEKSTSRRRGNYRGSSNGMEVEAMKRMVNRWEDDEEVGTVITNQDSKLGKVIRDSRWGVKHEFGANHAKKWEAVKRHAVVGIDGSWNHRRNGSAHIIDMIDVDSGPGRRLRGCGEIDLSVTRQLSGQQQWDGGGGNETNGEPMGRR
jgi:hypothetical protein